MMRAPLGFLVLLAFALGCATTGAARGPVPVAPRPLPLVLDPLTGSAPVDLTKLKGKVVLLDIWASWCAPCKEELPVLDDMARRLRPRGIEIVAVSIDEDRASAQAFLGGRSWSLILAHDPAGQVPELLQPPKMPTSYLIDAAGMLRYVSAGYERGDVPLIEARLLELAARP
jgi:thiol-disulfide isomerase/thioredoxin